MTERPVVHIVDDEEAIRKSAGFMLRTAGYAVHTWPSGVAFLVVDDVDHGSFSHRGPPGVRAGR
jgi:FixJ family two-component response regulator